MLGGEIEWLVHMIWTCASVLVSCHGIRCVARVSGLIVSRCFAVLDHDTKKTFNLAEKSQNFARISLIGKSSYVASRLGGGALNLANYKASQY